MISRIASKLGISTNILPNQSLIEAVDQLTKISRIVELEIEGAVKVIINDAEAYNRSIKALLELKSSRDLIFSVHAPHRHHTSNLASKNENIRHSFCQVLEKIIDFSADIGAKLVTCHPGYIDIDSNNYPFTNLEKSLQELFIYSEKRHISLCLENMGLEREKVSCSIS